MTNFIDYVERSLAFDAWFKNASDETKRRIFANIAKQNPLMDRLIKEGKIKDQKPNG